MKLILLSLWSFYSAVIYWVEMLTERKIVKLYQMKKRFFFSIEIFNFQNPINQLSFIAILSEYRPFHFINKLLPGLLNYKHAIQIGEPVKTMAIFRKSARTKNLQKNENIKPFVNASKQKKFLRWAVFVYWFKKVTFINVRIIVLHNVHF